MAMKRIAEIFMLALLISAVFIMIYSVFNRDSVSRGGALPGISGGEQLGLIKIEGLILKSKPVVELIERYRKDDDIKGVLVRIDSPGGGVAASQEIYEALKRIREQGKKVVVSMGAVAASGGYYIACAADTIVANPGTTTGSIGVIMELLDYSDLMGKIGIRANTIKSGKFKDAGNGWRRMTEEERQYLQQFIDDAYEQFLTVVQEARGMSRTEILEIAEGKIFTGKQALDLGLIDVLGTYDDARRLAAELSGIKGEPEVYEPKQRKRTFFDLIFGDVDAMLSEMQNLPVLRYQLVF